VNVVSSDRGAPSARWYRDAAREGEKEQVVAREKTLNNEVRTARPWQGLSLPPRNQDLSYVASVVSIFAPST
jgi:hypothetical protein